MSFGLLLTASGGGRLSPCPFRDSCPRVLRENVAHRRLLVGAGPRGMHRFAMWAVAPGGLYFKGQVLTFRAKSVCALYLGKRVGAGVVRLHPRLLSPSPFPGKLRPAEQAGCRTTGSPGLGFHLQQVGTSHALVVMTDAVIQ